MPNGSMCLIGLKLTRPSMRAVLSPQRSAIQPCAASCSVIAITTGSSQTESAWPIVAMSMAQAPGWSAGSTRAEQRRQTGLCGLAVERFRRTAPAQRPRGALGRRRPRAARPRPAPRPARRSGRCSARQGRSRRRARPRSARRSLPSSAPMLRSSLSRQPSKPSSPRITSAMIRADSVAGRSGSSAG